MSKESSLILLLKASRRDRPFADCVDPSSRSRERSRWSGRLKACVQFHPPDRYDDQDDGDDDDEEDHGDGCTSPLLSSFFMLCLSAHEFSLWMQSKLERALNFASRFAASSRVQAAWVLADESWLWSIASKATKKALKATKQAWLFI